MDCCFFVDRIYVNQAVVNGLSYAGEGIEVGVCELECGSVRHRRDKEVETRKCQCQQMFGRFRKGL